MLVAAVGELQWSHGILAMDSAACPALQRPSPLLQWSHGILAMDRRPAAGLGPIPGTLQWSHGILAMDRWLDLYLLHKHAEASMEPWHFSHG